MRVCGEGSPDKSYIFQLRNKEYGLDSFKNKGTPSNSYSRDAAQLVGFLLITGVVVGLFSISGLAFADTYVGVARCFVGVVVAGILIFSALGVVVAESVYLLQKQLSNITTTTIKNT